MYIFYLFLILTHTGLLIYVEIPNIWFQWSSNTSTGYHTNPITKKTHLTAKSNCKSPILWFVHKCNHGSIPKKIRTPNHGYRSTYQIHHTFLELLCNPYQGHYWIQSHCHYIIYPQQCIIFKLLRRTKFHRRIIFLDNQPLEPTKPPTVLPNTNVPLYVKWSIMRSILVLAMEA